MADDDNKFLGKEGELNKVDQNLIIVRDCLDEELKGRYLVVFSGKGTISESDLDINDFEAMVLSGREIKDVGNQSCLVFDSAFLRARHRELVDDFDLESTIKDEYQPYIPNGAMFEAAIEFGPERIL